MEPAIQQWSGANEAVGGWVRAVSAWAVAAGASPPRAEVGGAPGVACLDSSRRGVGQGRWTFVTARPLAIVKGRVGDVQIIDGSSGRVLDRGSDPFALLQRALDEHRGLTSEALREVPFQGGALGVFGYGCRLAVESLQADPPARWGEPDVWWGLYDTFLAWDGLAGRGVLVSWGLRRWGGAPDPGLARRRVRALAEHLDRGATSMDGRGLEVGLTPGWERERYASAFQRIQEGIAAGELYQGCLTYPMRAERAPEVTALALFDGLRRWSPAPYGALLATDGPVSLVSSSPERFMRVRGGQVTVRPMKGTRPRGRDRAEDRALRRELERSVKDRAENIMIVDLMRNDLGRVCRLGSVQVPRIFTVESYQTVHQMTSTVQAELKEGGHGLEAARACFPPGSMTGAPKVQAMKLLAELEGAPRGYYAGALGWVGWGGDLELSVVIRTALVSAREIAWHVGGGIVADSEPGAEWDESLAKCPEPLRRAVTGRGQGSPSARGEGVGSG
ncbi:MAG: aminodeoxychorismate/anthranilate synthase component I [Myxococcales bacterium]|nr:aminodeoxychorismate/anthranilate synthase component I [Myxococcales bacterium]